MAAGSDVRMGMRKNMCTDTCTDMHADNSMDAGIAMFADVSTETHAPKQAPSQNIYASTHIVHATHLSACPQMHLRISLSLSLHMHMDIRARLDAYMHCKHAQDFTQTPITMPTH